MKQKIIIAIVIALLAIAGIYLYMNSQNKDSKEINNNEQTTQDQSQKDDIVGDVPMDPKEDPLAPTTDTIAVSPQIAGSSVTIDNVFLSKPGFIDIHEATAAGEPGKSVGVSGYLGVGAKQDLEITAPIVAGKKYFAVVHYDNGDKKYTYPADAAAMKDSLPIQALFSVSQ